VVQGGRGFVKKGFKDECRRQVRAADRGQRQGLSEKERSSQEFFQRKGCESTSPIIIKEMQLGYVRSIGA
jgi:hypothetical protein